MNSSYIKRTVKNVEGRKIELYNIEYDRDETRNVAAGFNYRNLFAELIEQLERCYQRLKTTTSETVEIDEELRRNSKALGYTK